MASTSGSGTVKNRSAASIQITAEQILREASDRGLEETPQAPRQFITDQEELVAYQATKRKDFEDQLRRSRQQIGLWIRYAQWEASQNEFERTRSIFERALDVDYTAESLWLRYSEFEMKNGFLNHARNIFDRAVTILPRRDIFWYKYAYIEEVAGAIENARNVFERWMLWSPDDLAWNAYLKFEMRQNEIEKARQILERYVKQWPTSRAFIKYARWEENQYERSRARYIYERALTELHPHERNERLLVAFARFEERSKEFDRARLLFQYAIQQAIMTTSDRNIERESKIANGTWTPELEEELKNSQDEIHSLEQEFVAFEKCHGSKEDIETEVLRQRRAEYEELTVRDVYNYDAWLDYARLEETEASAEIELLLTQHGIVEGTSAFSEAVNNLESVRRTRVIYDRAVACVPLLREKVYWKRYIYLWVNYALFEELICRDIPCTRAVYAKALSTIPHREFTFGKIWMYAAQLEVRQKDLTAARRLLGNAIGLCGKPNLFRGYITLEQTLGEIDRCRAVYGKYLATCPASHVAWREFAELEMSLGESERARAILQLAIAQPEMDVPEAVWKALIDLEISEAQWGSARGLYESLLERTSAVGVWISFMRFEYTAGKATTGSEDFQPCGLVVMRDVAERAIAWMKREGRKEDRLAILEAWRDLEKTALSEGVPDASVEQYEQVEAKFPRKVRVSRMSEDGYGEVEVFDLVFPDDEKKMVGMKLLEKAMAWKAKMAELSAEMETSVPMETTTSSDVPAGFFDSSPEALLPIPPASNPEEMDI